MNRDFIESLKAALSGPLPGAEVQYKMATLARRQELPDLSKLTDYRESAVCILLYRKNEEWHFPLIERAIYEGVHSGQIAFPGGKRDEGDINLEYTALRELQEETGLNSSEITLIGELTRVYIPPSNFMVYPYVFEMASAPDFSHDPIEVQQILEVPLNELLKDDIVKETTLDVRGYKIKTPYFDIRGKIVWGATAMMLNEFKSIIASSQSL